MIEDVKQALRALPVRRWMLALTTVLSISSAQAVAAADDPLPSWREGLPRALLEAAACARPLVATDVPGCREICIADETGLVVPAQDAEALAAALLRMLDDAALAARCALAARAKVEREFTLARIADQTLALYRQLGGRA